MMTEDEKAELAGVYERAAEYLEQYGWRQSDFGEKDGPACFRGAILHTSGYDMSVTASSTAVRILELEEGCPVPGCYCPIEDWNDDPQRTKDEVINTLHALANKLR